MTSPTLGEGRAKRGAGIAVIVAIVEVLFGLLFSSGGLPIPLGDAQLDFTTWDASTEKQPQLELEKNLSIDGEWVDRLRWTRLNMLSKSDGTISVQFQSSNRCGLGGCVKLERSAVFLGGIVTFDRPVKMLNGDTFRRLYAANSRDMTLFIPSIYVDKVSVEAQTPSRGILSRTESWSRAD